VTLTSPTRISEEQVILVTGGLGFIGSHTVRALLDAGETCAVTQHHKSSVPDFLGADVGTGLFIEAADIENGETLSGIGDRYEITGSSTSPTQPSLTSLTLSSTPLHCGSRI
jgi:NAD(P)-dependent dehydrogenase (short-subunit alcohol dehydrogenase family)